jgi:aldose 1-epimerase
VELFTLRNGSSIEISAMTYGATITSLRVPDVDGNFENVVLGFDTLEPYLGRRLYLGSVVGRYANRIAHGRFSLGERTYQLTTNDGLHHLHGGRAGFHARMWNAAITSGKESISLVFSRVSANGEEHYPGALFATVSYTLGAGHDVTIQYEATSDRPTIVNLTQHAYFNLSGDPRRTVLDHQLTIAASAYTPVDDSLIPLGTIAPVDATPFDFRLPTAIGLRIHSDHPQLRHGQGYDHNWVLDRKAPGLIPAALANDPSTGRTLEVWTTEPGLQLYTGNRLDGRVSSNDEFALHTGFCLETQHFPDSPNHPGFPSTVLAPGEVFRSTTVWKFDRRPAESGRSIAQGHASNGRHDRLSRAR